MTSKTVPAPDIQTVLGLKGSKLRSGGWGGGLLDTRTHGTLTTYLPCSPSAQLPSPYHTFHSQAGSLFGSNSCKGQPRHLKDEKARLSDELGTFHWDES